MIIIDTVRDHFERGYWLSCWCRKCKGFVDCSLQPLDPACGSKCDSAAA
jgi:hypothetical protein